MLEVERSLNDNIVDLDQENVYRLLGSDNSNIPVPADVTALEFSGRQYLFDSGLYHRLEGLLRRRVPRDPVRGGRR